MLDTRIARVTYLSWLELMISSMLELSDYQQELLKRCLIVVVDSCRSPSFSCHSMKIWFHLFDKFFKKMKPSMNFDWFQSTFFFNEVKRRQDIEPITPTYLYPSLPQAIGQHELVSECAVIGQEDEVMGEKPLAFVVMRPGV